MLTAEERQEIATKLAEYPTRQAMSIESMLIVQRHRGWVSDESLKDLSNFSASPLLTSTGLPLFITSFAASRLAATSR